MLRGYKMLTKLDWIKHEGKTAQGKKELIKHLEGGRLTLKQAIKSHCYDCCGYFFDGKVDCKLPDCSLYPFMAYNPQRNTIKYKKEGKKMSETEKVDLRVRMQAGRKKK